MYINKSQTNFKGLFNIPSSMNRPQMSSQIKRLQTLIRTQVALLHIAHGLPDVGVLSGVMVSVRNGIFIGFAAFATLYSSVFQFRIRQV